VKGSVPPGYYTGLAFKLGLPFDLDHGDATIAASPLNFTAMFWVWASGYRFLKIDLAAGRPALRSISPAATAQHRK
jgi:hypothetical protein